MKKLIAIILAALCIGNNVAELPQTNTYAEYMRVVAIIENAIVVSDKDGDAWEFYGNPSSFELGSLVKVTLDDNGTENIHDDIIVNVK